MTVPGPATQINLADCSPVFGPGGIKPAGLSRSAACLSLELAVTSYSMNTDPWRDAGWRDFSILADNDLLTGSALNGPAASPLEELSRGVRQKLTHMRLTMRDPVTQYLGFKRQQDENAGACKAVVMARPCGTYIVIGIGFKGTGKRLFDWIPNLRITPADGYHGGFAQVAGQFAEACGRIEFPETARELGLSRLTLSEILTYMRIPSSPFRLWVCGHSQGAAVAQVFIDRLVQSGIAAQNVSGFGFASPSVTVEHRRNARQLPMNHILNADDLIPRVGFTGHLGQCWLFVPDDRERAELYGNEWNSPCFREVLEVYRRAEDTDDVLVMGMAALDLIGVQSSDTLYRVLSAAEQVPLLSDWLKPTADITMPVVNGLAGKLREQYRTVTGGREVPQEQLDAYRGRFGDLAARYGMTNWAMAALRAAALPHRMYAADMGKGTVRTAYQYIVTGHTEELIGTADPVGVYPRPAEPDRRTETAEKTQKTDKTEQTAKLNGTLKQPASGFLPPLRRFAPPGPGLPEKGKVRLTLPKKPANFVSLRPVSPISAARIEKKTQKTTPAPETPAADLTDQPSGSIPDKQE